MMLENSPVSPRLSSLGPGYRPSNERLHRETCHWSLSVGKTLSAIFCFWPLVVSSAGNTPPAPRTAIPVGPVEEVVVRGRATNFIDVTVIPPDSNSQRCSSVDPRKIEIRVRGERREIVMIENQGQMVLTDTASQSKDELTSPSPATTQPIVYVLYFDDFVGGRFGAERMYKTLMRNGVFGSADRFLLAKWQHGDVYIEHDVFDDPHQAAFFLNDFLEADERPNGLLGEAIRRDRSPPGFLKERPQDPSESDPFVSMDVVGKQNWLRSWKILLAALASIDGRKVILLPLTATPAAIEDGDASSRITELARQANVEVASLDVYQSLSGNSIHSAGVPFFSEATGGPVFFHQASEESFDKSILAIRQRVACRFRVTYRSGTAAASRLEPGISASYAGDSRIRVEVPRYNAPSAESTIPEEKLAIRKDTARVLLPSAGEGFSGAVAVMLKSPEMIGTRKVPKAWRVQLTADIRMTRQRRVDEQIRATYSIWQNARKPLVSIEQTFSSGEVRMMQEQGLRVAHPIRDSLRPGPYSVLLVITGEQGRVLFTATSTLYVPRTIVHEVPVDVIPSIDTPQWLLTDSAIGIVGGVQSPIMAPVLSRIIDFGQPIEIQGYACPTREMMEEIRSNKMIAKLKHAESGDVRAVGVSVIEESAFQHDDRVCAVLCGRLVRESEPLSPGGWSLEVVDQLMAHGAFRERTKPLRIWVKKAPSIN